MGSSNHFGFPVAWIIDGQLDDQKPVITLVYVICLLWVDFSRSVGCDSAAMDIGKNFCGKMPAKRGHSDSVSEAPNLMDVR